MLGIKNMYRILYKQIRFQVFQKYFAITRVSIPNTFKQYFTQISILLTIKVSLKKIVLAYI